MRRFCAQHWICFLVICKVIRCIDVSPILQIYTEFGGNLGYHVPDRVKSHFQSIPEVQVRDYLSYNRFTGNFSHQKAEECLILSFGNGSLSRSLIPSFELSSMPEESFRVIITETHSYSASCKYLVAANGLPLRPDTHENVSFNKDDVHYGAVVATYAALESLGFAFLHPLKPYIPSFISMDSCYERDSTICLLNITESPYWPERAFHIHTQHPLELTEVLQGYDIPQFGPHGPHCSVFSQRKYNDSFQNKIKSKPHTMYCERWEDMVDDVNRMYEWAVANRLNKLEWLLLGNFKWGEDADTRMKRFRILTSLAHDYSLLVGADCPLVNQQQHAWAVVDPRASLPNQLQAIRDRVDWIFSAGFDFLTTESGLSEFTHPECELMLALMNEFADYTNKTWGREAGIKVHCSTGQTCEAYLDPNTDDPVNFNFLTMFASSTLGVFPHTVQVYALDDPSAGAYGNDNFSYIEDYMVYEAKKGNRSVVFYGETAYWVNVDIDVPLFMPLYGQRRQHDLRRMAVREIRENFRIDGQMNFDSGWEWGYWLSDVVTARASWNPYIPSRDIISQGMDSESKYEAQVDKWEAFAQSLEPFTKLYRRSGLDQILKDILVELTKEQERLLIYGKTDESSDEPNPNIRKLTGIAYLSGGDTWIDLPRMLGMSILQADKVRMKETTDELWPYVLPLLREMERVFTSLFKRMKVLYDDASSYSSESCSLNSAHNSRHGGYKCDSGIERSKLLNSEALLLLHEILDCMQLLAMRATQVRLLYESVENPTPSAKASLQRESRAVINAASDIVLKREENYRVPWQRIASWRENPTVYRYGYVWSVHSLYYWWRDQGLAEGGSLQSEHSPCYLNRMDASEVAVGWGKYSLEVIRTVINWFSPFFSRHPFEFVNCFAPPPDGYEFPRDLYPI